MQICRVFLRDLQYKYTIVFGKHGVEMKALDQQEAELMYLTFQTNKRSGGKKILVRGLGQFCLSGFSSSQPCEKGDLFVSDVGVACDAAYNYKRVIFEAFSDRSTF